MRDPSVRLRGRDRCARQHRPVPAHAAPVRVASWPQQTASCLLTWSGWRDSNPRPPAPKAGALTKLRYIPCAAPVPGRRHDLRPTRASLRESAEPVGSPLLARLEAGQGVRRVNGEHLADLAADWPVPMVRAACDRSDAARSRRSAGGSTCLLLCRVAHCLMLRSVSAVPQGWNAAQRWSLAGALAGSGYATHGCRLAGVAQW